MFVFEMDEARMMMMLFGLVECCIQCRRLKRLLLQTIVENYDIDERRFSKKEAKI